METTCVRHSLRSGLGPRWWQGLRPMARGPARGDGGVDACGYARRQYVDSADGLTDRRGVSYQHVMTGPSRGRHQRHAGCVPCSACGFGAGGMCGGGTVAEDLAVGLRGHTCESVEVLAQVRGVAEAGALGDPL